MDIKVLAAAKKYAEELLAGGSSIVELIQEKVESYLSSNPITTKQVSMTSSSATIQPNKLYRWGEVETLTISLAAPVDTESANEYMFEFQSGATATQLTLPDTIAWVTEPTIESNKTYQCSILNGIGVIAGA